MRVILSPTARSQVRAIDEWWRAHRSAAPDLFSEEFAGAIQMLAALPWIGHAHPHATEREVRRVSLRATRYHVYYRASGDVLEILTVWSAVRGSGPDLRHLT